MTGFFFKKFVNTTSPRFTKYFNYTGLHPSSTWISIRFSVTNYIFHALFYIRIPIIKTSSICSCDPFHSMKASLIIVF